MIDDEQLSFDDGEEYIPSYALEEEAEETPEAPDVSYTKAQIDKMLADARAEAQADAIKELAPKAEAPIPTDAYQYVRAAWDMERDMLQEVKDELPDMPKEVEAEVTKLLRECQNIDQLKYLRGKNYHKDIAEAAYSRMVRSGKHVPVNYGSYVAAAPTGSVRPTRLNESTNREVAEMERVLGVKFSSDDLKKGKLM